MSPKRVQLRRTKGWRKPADTIVVARPTKWGNPYVIVADDSGERTGWWVFGPDREPVGFEDDIGQARQVAVDWFEDEYLSSDAGRRLPIHELRGHDLACWCPLEDDGRRAPCHADVLLELANGDW